MVKKEPPDSEPKSAPAASKPAEAKQRFASWVQGLQYQARAKEAAVVSSTVPLPDEPRTVMQSDPPAVYHQLPEEIALLKAARLQRLSAVPDGSLGPSSSPLMVSTPVPLPNVMASPNALPSTKPPPPPSSRPSSSKPPASGRITAPPPRDASTPGSMAYGGELQSDELTAVFAPPPELLARSGAYPSPGPGNWEEPTQVVQVGDVLGTFAAAQSQPPAGQGPSPSQGPTLEQLDFERRLAVLATPVPTEPRRTRWLLWALVTVLLGAAAAALLEYSLHPGRLG